MGVHRNEKLILQKIFSIVSSILVHRKREKNAKLYIMKNSRARKTISTSRWLLNWFFTISSI